MQVAAGVGLKRLARPGGHRDSELVELVLDEASHLVVGRDGEVRIEVHVETARLREGNEVDEPAMQRRLAKAVQRQLRARLQLGDDLAEAIAGHIAIQVAHRVVAEVAFQIALHRELDIDVLERGQLDAGTDRRHAHRQHTHRAHDRSTFFMRIRSRTVNSCSSSPPSIG